MKKERERGKREGRERGKEGGRKELSEVTLRRHRLGRETDV